MCVTKTPFFGPKKPRTRNSSYYFVAFSSLSTTKHKHVLNPLFLECCSKLKNEIFQKLNLKHKNLEKMHPFFDHLWRQKELLESDPATQGFDGTWGLVVDTHPEWKDVLHVDHWCDAQHVQRQGTWAAKELLVKWRRDQGRRIWPVAVSASHQHSTGSSNAVKSANARFPWTGSGFDLTLGMSATYTGPGEDKTSLLATAQSPGSINPAKGTSSSATSSTAKDDVTSSMPPPSVPSSALSKAGSAGSAAGNQKDTGAQVPTAKGPPVPQMSGTETAKGPPTRPASDSAVTASTAPKTSQFSQAIQGNFPTLTESMGKSGPPKKSSPWAASKNRSGSLSLKAAYSSMASTAAPGKGDDTKTASSPRSAAAPASTEASGTARATSSKSGAKILEEIHR